jgi:hypothetical protein
MNTEERVREVVDQLPQDGIELQSGFIRSFEIRTSQLEFCTLSQVQVDNRILL